MSPKAALRAALIVSAVAVPAVPAQAATHPIAASAVAGSIVTFDLPTVKPRAVLGAAVRTSGNRTVKRVSLKRVRRALRRQRALRVKTSAGPKARLAMRWDRTAPQTTLLTGPAGTVTATTASFTFSSSERKSTFQCRIDAKPWFGCTTPATISALLVGTHVFEVRARDRAGNIDATAASRTWTIAAPVVAPEPAVVAQPAPTPEPEPTVREPEPEPQPAPAPEPTNGLKATFDGSDGIFAGAAAFWDSSDAGLWQNTDWFAESGTIYRRANTGWADAPVFRMWSRRTDLAFPSAQMDIRFNKWSGGSYGWHGINLWLNRKLVSGSKINDGIQEGYTVDFMNRDGKLYIQKKVGDTYHILSTKTWSPVPGRWYRWGGRVVDNGNGTATIQVIADGVVIQEVTDTGAKGGPILKGGRAGLRGDYADFNVENLSITP